MNKQTQPASEVDEDAALVELTSILPATDRLRFAALGRTGLLSSAKQKSLLRTEKAMVARMGADAPQVRLARSRLEIEKRFDTAVAVEAQRTQATRVTRNPSALILHGRVVNVKRLAVPGLTVSAIDQQGKAVVFTGTDDNGYFSLEVPASADTAGQFVTLLVSDREQAIHYRGCECFAREPGKIYYRELVVGTTPPSQPPTEPPDVDPKVVTVPDVRGLLEETATARLRALSLQVEATTRESTANNAGRVIDQDPPGGVEVACCSTVKIVVGTAAPTVQVPNLVGLTLREVDAVLEKANLTRGTVEPDDAPLQAKVVQQSPTAGASVPPGTPVNLVVQEDVQFVTVPNVVESTLKDAKKILKDAKLKVGQVEPADAKDDSLVVAQKPAAGSQAPQGSAVDLTVRQPSTSVDVPQLIRLEFAAARATLEKAGLKLGKVKPASASEKSIVIGQSPEAGSAVKPASAVDLELRATEPASPRPRPEIRPEKRGASPGNKAAQKRAPARKATKRARKPTSEEET